ncbi:unnamed protein product [Closterium sp. Naga37s-1]|nr:unnamed protein product [Closterium sp. Naga37s-1]
MQGCSQPCRPPGSLLLSSSVPSAGPFLESTPPFPHRPHIDSQGWLLSAVQTTWLAATLLQCAIGRPPLGTSALSLTSPPPALSIFPLSCPVLHHRAALSRANHLASRYSPPVRHWPASPQLPLSLLTRHPTGGFAFRGCHLCATSHRPLLFPQELPIHASHLWRVPAVAWPLALAASAGLADLDTYSNAPGDILAGVALGTLVAVIAFWRFFSAPCRGFESRVSPWLGFETLRDGSPPPKPPSAATPT